jgi:arginine-tRNA-protein transferase
MVYYHVHELAALSPAKLDEYLAAGWYRMQQLIFTTDLITKDDALIPVFWLRHVVDAYKPAASHNKINKLCKNYSVNITPLHITTELEELYAQYRHSVDFDISPTLQDSLRGETMNSIYNTTCIEVRDGRKLLAAGILDEGVKSIAGILNFYHPDYAAKSLGKFLMLQKMLYARQKGKAYYYTGYMSTAFSKFDYKLWVGAGCTEVYNRKDDSWVPWGDVKKEIMEGWLGGDG